MLYDLNNPLQKEQFLARAAHLAKKGGTVELTSKVYRSMNQNNFLHSILSYFALQYGETLDYVKVEFFKKTVNPDIFWVERENPLRGRYKTLRSTASLSMEEMSLCITRFRDWSAKEANIYLPSPEDHAMIKAIDVETSRMKAYL